MIDDELYQDCNCKRCKKEQKCWKKDEGTGEFKAELFDFAVYGDEDNLEFGCANFKDLNDNSKDDDIKIIMDVSTGEFKVVRKRLED
ncbi:hypothetical protein [Petroclostridium sp. X23]|uniref:hypothetical protein n=1 Tax=Petroclostridium sp. X23 TaxID=3045146 RepID=UPI0024AD7E26|nr:hypothetical protein [Petroclostridium sp. X23]WHH57283.1 hypothetical protein QKW49_15760 [Petroclostridium sp. X23]